MAGTTTKVVYADDHGGSFAIRIPNWSATLQSATSATTEPRLPAGTRPRRRFAVNSAGREVSIIVVGMAGNAVWGAAPSTTATWYTAALASAGETVTYAGWTGEDKKP